MDSATKRVLALANNFAPMSATEVASDVAANVVKSTANPIEATFNAVQTGGAASLENASNARAKMICDNNSENTGFNNLIDSFGCALHKLDGSPIFLGVVVVLLLLVYFGSMRIPDTARRLMNHHAIMLVLFGTVGVCLAFQQVKLALLLLVTFFILRTELNVDKREKKQVRFVKEVSASNDDVPCQNGGLDGYGDFVGSPIL